jgi:uncharacterized protein (TIGR00730 family)
MTPIHRGYGTFEELLEIITWSKMGIHDKPIGLLNVNHYYDPLLAQIERGVEDGFIEPEFQNILVVGTTIQELFTAFHHYKSPPGYVTRITKKDI